MVDNKTVEYKRGDVYFVKMVHPTVGYELDANRPAVIVSNDIGNKHSLVVEVVFLTTQEKKPLPTHAEIRCTGKTSTALCEQVTTVSKDRLGKYFGTCSEDEMRMIDRAIMISLGLDEKVDVQGGSDSVDQTQGHGEELVKELETVRKEMEVYKTLYEIVRMALER